MSLILIVEDSVNLSFALLEAFQQEGHKANVAYTAKEAIEKVKNKRFDLILLDLNLPDAKGTELLQKLLNIEPELPIIVITGEKNPKIAVESLKMGVFDYLIKPFELEEVMLAVHRALEGTRLKEELYRRRLESIPSYTVAHSKLMRIVIEEARRIAMAWPLPILITGETGTGKDHLAAFIHSVCPGDEGPFIRVNIPAIPPTLFEAELFGVDKGAYTGAYARRKGLLELAHEGTLFLNEIGELDVPFQVKLLQVIEDKSIRRLGGQEEISVNFRLLAATNQDITKMVKKGSFRQDLFYRLSTFHLHIPPLRERKEDIIPLAKYFLMQLEKTTGHKAPSIEPLSLKLVNYHWPGNVRELRNVIERYFFLKEVRFGLEITPSKVKDTSHFPTLQEIEKEHILNALKFSKGNKTKAAKLLGISRSTLQRKLSCINFGDLI